MACGTTSRNLLELSNRDTLEESAKGLRFINPEALQRRNLMDA
jgi:hypothetical protein